MKSLIFAGLVALSACGGSAQTGGSGAGKPAGQKTLYDRLGGIEPIKAVVHDFVQNLVADSRINGRFLNSDKAHLEQMLDDQICQETGGPCTYTGKSMEEVHTGMHITNDEFTALVEDLVKSLNKFNVPKAEQDELLGKLGGLKAKVVGL